MELLRGAGAETVFFDPTTDEKLPEHTDDLFIVWGFPESYTEALSENELLRGEVHAFARSGRPVLAECGGLLYLCRELDGRRMCGVLDAAARMTDRLSLGYREARALASSPLAERGVTMRGHEFHYSNVEPEAGSPPDVSPAWDLLGCGKEGFVVDGVHASYLHTHWAATPETPRRFVYSAVRTAARIPRTRPVKMRI